jgi:membrane protein YdbS with pleckstrin-like domain
MENPKKEKPTALFKSEPVQNMKSNFGILAFVGWFLVGMFGIVSWIYWTYTSYWSIYIGLCVFFFCLCYIVFWVAYRFHLPFLEIHEQGIYLRPKFMIWQRRFYPFTSIKTVETRGAPGYNRYYSSEGVIYAGGDRIIIFFNDTHTYQLLTTYCDDIKTPFMLITERLTPKSDAPISKECEICHKHPVSYRCIKCGIRTCDDCGDADECLSCRVHTLFRRSLFCFGFYAIPVLCLIYGQTNLHLPFFTMYQYEVDMRFGPGYALFMWAWTNGLTGIGCIWLGFGFYSAAFSIIRYEKTMVWSREKSIIIAATVLGIAILVMKIIYFIQVLIGFADILKIMLVLEVGIGDIFLYFTFRIASYKSRFRATSEQHLYSFMNISGIIISLLSIINGIIGIISMISYIKT